MSAVRSLLIELAMKDDVTSRLDTIDTKLDALHNQTTSSQSAFDELTQSTDSFGNESSRSIADVKEEVGDLEETTTRGVSTWDQVTTTLSENWNTVALAIGGAALAVEAFNRLQQEMLFDAEKLAYSLGQSRSEVVAFAVSLTDSTRPTEEVYELLELGRQQGLRTKEELEEYVIAWDAIGDVSGESAPALAKLGIAMSALGVGANNVRDAYNSLGFVMEHTSMTQSEFLRLVQYTAPELLEMGMSIEDTAAMLGVLNERGIAGRPAITELRKGMNAAKGDVNALYSELNIATEDMDRMYAKMESGAVYIDDMAQAFYDSRTPLQVIQTEIGKFLHVLGDEFSPITQTASVLMSGASTAMMTMAAASIILDSAMMKSYLPAVLKATAGTWAFTTALLANPLVLVATAAIGLGIALYLLWDNWDEVSGWFMDTFEGFRDLLVGGMEWIGNTWDTVVGGVVAGTEWLGEKMEMLKWLFPFTYPIMGMQMLMENWDRITEYLAEIDLFQIGVDILMGFADGILSMNEHIRDTMLGIGETIVDSVKGFFGIASPSKLMSGFGENVAEGFWEGLDRGNDIFDVPEIASRQIASISPQGIVVNPQIYENVSEEGFKRDVFGGGVGSCVINSVVNLPLSTSLNPEEIARSVEVTLTRVFDTFANDYFSRQRRMI